ncbi:hypothetical protein MC7420_5193 [Coleofasciculus chthonoplastes PCC 7420]|uniref:Uncharacterized protein n=1 Tax=Coleofasciculus chthonoplastes PCC 7420 TaxID=118168 RepID=B4W2H8_9CYAN|nr:hypothetical protein [Coleofasciculus chthonoplastes]EDX71568.1 hypothetical protein MC7420_5193 [Coleofasciculus chthonoplastes PCC 7420]
MKTALNIITLTLLVSSPGVIGYAETTMSKPREIAQASNQQAQSLPVALPDDALVWPKSGSSIIGQLTALSEQGLTISKNNFSQTLSLSEVNRIEFQGDVWIRDRQGRRVRKFRSEDSSKTKQEVWQGVPIRAFQLQNPETASLRLGTVLSREDLQDILSISKDSVYIVDAIEFDSSGQMMTIKATPIDR